MKKLFTLTLSLLMLGFTFAQNGFIVNICGNVANTNGQSVPVVIEVFGALSQTTFTDTSGNYCDSLWIACNGTSGYYGIYANAVNGCGVWAQDYDSVTIINPLCVDQNVTLDLYQCDSASVPACDVSFQYTGANGTIGGTLDFYGSSLSTATTWTWSMGDGTTYTNQVVSHLYSAPGSYMVCLDVTDIYGQNCSYCDSVVVTDTSGTTNCIVDFGFTTDSCGVVYFTNNSTTGWAYWDFGDGEYSSDWDPIHEYNGSGSYIVSLTIFTNSGCQEFAQSIVTITDDGCLPTGSGCYADFMLYYTDWWNNPGQLQAYNYSANSNTNGTYLWDFGDGTTSTDYEPIHTYATTGLFTVCLTVDDGNGCTSTTCYTCYIEGADQGTGFTDDPDSTGTGCEAYFVAVVDSAFQDSVLYIVNLSVGNNLTFTWDFGDGSTSNLGNPSYTYATNGDYIICLTADDNNGCISTFCDTIGYDGNGFVIGKQASVGSDNGFRIQVAGAPGIIQTTTLVSKLEIGTSINVFPNPTSNQVTIDLNGSTGSTSLELRNMTGQLLLNENNNGSGASLLNLSLETYPEGIYFLSVTNGESTHVVKIVKSK